MLSRVSWVAPILLLTGPLAAQSSFIRGDLNGDGELTLADAVFLARAVASRGELPCADAGDFTDNGLVQLGDVALLIEWLLKGRPAVPAPFPGPGVDLSEDGLGCGEVPVSSPGEDPESGYTLSVAPAPGGALRVRVSLENTAPAIGGRLLVRLPEALSRGAKVLEVRPGLELVVAMREDHVVAADITGGGELAVVWLLSIAGEAEALVAGAMRQLLEVVLCPGTAPAGEYVLEGVARGELVAEDGGRVVVGVEGTMAVIAAPGAACREPVPTRETLRPYVWMDDVVTRVGQRFRLHVYGTANHPYLTAAFRVVWDPTVLRVSGVEKMREESTVTGFIINFDGHDPQSEASVLRRTQSDPFVDVYYCDPCKNPRNPVYAGFQNWNWHSIGYAGEPSTNFPPDQEFHHIDLIFDVLPSAQPGEAWIRLEESPRTAAYDNYVWVKGLVDVYFPARPLLDGKVTILPRLRRDSFIRGDANMDGALGLTDAIVTFSNLFQAPRPFDCPDSADSNDDGLVDIADGIYSLSFLFLGTPAPPAPFPAPGEDPTEDGLGCEE